MVARHEPTVQEQFWAQEQLRIAAQIATSERPENVRRPDIRDVSAKSAPIKPTERQYCPTLFEAPPLELVANQMNKV
jgi:hypothetical protein